MRFLIIILILVLAGCGESERNKSRLKETLIGDELRAVQKAEGLESTVLEAAQKQKEEIDQQSR